MPSTGELSDARIIVVGAGAVGSCLAYRLAQAGADVTVVERGYPGGATSGNSVAWLNAFAKYPRHYYRLSTDSIREHRDLEWELGGNWLTLNGGVHWEGRDQHSQFGDLTQSVKRMRSWGARIEAMSGADFTRRFEPGLCLEREADTVYLVRDEGWVQPALMIRALLHAAVTEYGARLVTADVERLVGADGQVNGVVLAGGERLEADVVVVAGGPASGGLASTAGGHLPIETSVGLLAVTAPSPALLDRIVIGPDIIVRPDGGGRLLVTSEALSSVDAATAPSPDLPEVRALAARVQELIPSLRTVPIEAMRKGVRALPTDGYPIVGFAPGISGLYYAVMHSGVTLCAGIASLVVNDLCDPDFDGLAPYRPDRFAASTIQGPSGE